MSSLSIEQSNVIYRSSKKQMQGICNLPRDIKFDILSRLLVKDLCKFRCVSKHWCNLISNPTFLDFYHERSRDNPQILMMNDSKNDDNEQQLIHLTSMDLDGKVGNELMTSIYGECIDMLPSGHGLICLFYENHFYLYNPATQEFVSLVEGSLSPCNDHGAGFGYVMSTKEYKAVHMFTQSESSTGFNIGCEILTLSNGDEASSRPWRVIDQCCPYGVTGCALLVNNVFYWTRADKHGNSRDYDLILALDLEEENFRTIRLPNPSSYDEENYMFLVELRGFLCLVDNFAIPPMMNIWMLKDANNITWVKEYSIRFDILDGFDDVYTIVTPLLYHNEEIVVDSDQDNLHYYNVEKESFRRGKRLNMQWDTNQTWERPLRKTRLSLYTESFFSLGSR